MTKILVAVLTSGKPEKLDRCLRSVKSNSSPHERIVVINTTNPDYTSLATEIALKHGFPVTVTESNGTPGRGKNSVLKHFLMTDADWLMQIDGDDYISPNCISKLHDEINNNNFDIGCLVNGSAIRPSGKIIKINEIDVLPKIIRYVMKWADTDVEYLVNHKQFIASRTFNGERFNRMILYNRKAAKHRYNETLDIAEDLLFFLQAKKIFSVHGITADEDNFLYMYDFTDDGAVMEALINKKFISNIRAMMIEYGDDE